VADTKTTDEVAAAALDGTELIRGVQTAANVKITAAQVRTFAIAAHEAAGDPHPQYLTAAEGDALFLTPAEGTAAYAALADAYSNEKVDDRVAVLVLNGTGLTWTYDDGLNTFTGNVSLASFSTTNLAEGANLYYTDERVDDRVAALIQNGTGITWTYSDVGNTLTGNVSIAQYTDELAQDAVGAMVDASLTYVDATPLLQRAALTGDVTAAAGSNATAIANDAVTYAKMQNVSAASRLLGRGSAAGAGDPEEITLGAGLVMTGASLASTGGAAGATTTEILQGVSTTVFGTPDSIAALWEKGSDIASAATISIGEGGYFHVTGTTTITDIDVGTDKAGRIFWLIFDNALILTFNNPTLILPGGANISTNSFDIGCFVSEDGTNNIQCLGYWRSIQPPSYADQAIMESASGLNSIVTPTSTKWHPGVVKFWVCATGNSTTMVASYNMTSWADTAVGDADGTIATDFSSANWCGLCNTLDNTVAWDAANTQGSGFNTKAAGTFGVLCSTITDGGTAVASLTDPDQWNVVGYGDQ
jgi:hypothetical protein